MEKYTFVVEKKDAGQRLDQYLTRSFSSRFSRSFVQQLIEKESVLLNGRATTSHHKIREGDSIEVGVPEPSPSDIVAENIPLDIVYEDEDVAVVNKPPGMVVHPASGNYSGTLLNALLWHSGKLSELGGRTRAGIVHRLDKDTSGLLVVAKTDYAHRDLAKQFKARTVERSYIALVRGTIYLDEGVIDAPIGRSPSHRQKMAVSFLGQKTAVTYYKVLEKFPGNAPSGENFTIVEVKPRTGRTHQIRVHMAYIGHSLLGDTKYGTKGGFARVALHAQTIKFRHPKSGEDMEFSVDLPLDMKQFISQAKESKAFEGGGPHERGVKISEQGK